MESCSIIIYILRRFPRCAFVFVSIVHGILLVGVGVPPNPVASYQKRVESLVALLLWPPSPTAPLFSPFIQFMPFAATGAAVYNKSDPHPLLLLILLLLPLLLRRLPPEL